MSHRGSKARAAAAWPLAQYRLGRAAGKAGGPAATADQHYQRGYRDGVVFREALEARWAERLQRARRMRAAP